jgi:hypothetical protein
MMRRIARRGRHHIVCFAIGMALAGTAYADYPQENWVLLGLHTGMGHVYMRDTAKDVDAVSVYGDEGLPIFRTKAACEVALRYAIQKYSGKSHAEGNFGRYLCADVRTWRTGSPLDNRDMMPAPLQSHSPGVQAK